MGEETQVYGGGCGSYCNGWTQYLDVWWLGYHELHLARSFGVSSPQTTYVPQH